MTTHNKLAIAALSGLFAAGMMVSGSAFADHHTADKATSTTTTTEKHACKTEAGKEKHACKGQNSCKGNSPDGKSECKGHSDCATDGSKPAAE